MDPADDPFTVKPPDPEFVEMEDAMRRKGMRFAMIIMGFGLAAMLAAVASWASGGAGMWPLYTLGGGVVMLVWGVLHFFKMKDRDY